jgi:hypothetical protein
MVNPPLFSELKVLMGIVLLFVSHLNQHEQLVYNVRSTELPPHHMPLPGVQVSGTMMVSSFAAEGWLMCSEPPPFPVWSTAASKLKLEPPYQFHMWPVTGLESSKVLTTITGELNPTDVDNAKPIKAEGIQRCSFCFIVFIFVFSF